MHLRKLGVVLSTIALSATWWPHCRPGPAQALRPDSRPIVSPVPARARKSGSSARSAHGRAGDTREVSAAEARAIETRTQQALKKKGLSTGRALAGPASRSTST